MNIVITGASKGIGKSILEKFADDMQGHTFFLCARNEEVLQQVSIEIQGRFPRTLLNYMAADLSIPEEIERFASWILEHTSEIDILINNAGYYLPGSTYNEPNGTLEQMLQANLLSAYHLTRKLVPAMILRKSGHIFFTCSIASKKAYNNGGAYSISKFALYGFAQNLREELKEHFIKVTAILPGAVFTDSWQGFDNSNNRIMEGKDIAALVYTAAHLSSQACVEEIVVRPQLGDL